MADWQWDAMERPDLSKIKVRVKIVGTEGYFTRVCSDKTKGNSFKLKDSRFGLDFGKKFSPVRVVRR